MGLGFYGRSFQLQDPKCNKPGCIFAGGAAKGGCSGESGILTYREIQEIIKRDKLKPFHDKKAGVKYITYQTNQWVSFVSLQPLVLHVENVWLTDFRMMRRHSNRKRSLQKNLDSEGT